MRRASMKSSFARSGRRTRSGTGGTRGRPSWLSISLREVVGGRVRWQSACKAAHAQRQTNSIRTHSSISDGAFVPDTYTVRMACVSRARERRMSGAGLQEASSVFRCAPG